MAITRSLLLLLVAVVCFVIAFLIAAGVVGWTHEPAWIAAGLALFAASFLP